MIDSVSSVILDQVRKFSGYVSYLHSLISWTLGVLSSYRRLSLCLLQIADDESDLLRGNLRAVGLSEINFSLFLPKCFQTTLVTLELAQVNVKLFITHRYVTDSGIRLPLPFKRKRTQLKSAEGKLFHALMIEIQSRNFQAFTHFVENEIQDMYNFNIYETINDFNEMDTNNEPKE
uniref:Uncharacterized protein n=1 Tax=Glossina austeni TaxID=7395 RepID=A0A1A9UPE3_GLOAU